MAVAAKSTIAAERVLTEAGWCDKAEVRIAEESIEAIASTNRPPDAAYLVPGFVDLQVNGFDDIDLATSSPDRWPELAQKLLSCGVTSWLLTLISRPLDSYETWLKDATTFVGEHHYPRALGVHLEGPWLGELRGAHVDVASGPVDLDWCNSLPSTVRVVTLGPERPAAVEAIKILRDRGIVVALGHSNANHQVAHQAFDAGASLLTHCFNATTPMHHRDPGLTAAALVRDDVFISLIADGHHVHPDMLKMAVRAKGLQRTILVSDSSAWSAGVLGSTTIDLVDDVPRTPEGGLAGSALTLDVAIRYLVNEVGLALDDAVRAASTVPARLLGEPDIGVIRAAATADLVALDDTLNVSGVWLRGQRFV